MDKPVFDLSDYIVGFAGAAASAQSIMSRGDNPMSIQGFRFKFNVTADFNSKGGPKKQAVYRVKRIGLKEQLLMDYKESMGIEIECTLVSAFEET